MPTAHKVIVLDTTPLGFLSNPSGRPKAQFAEQWLAALRAAGHRVVVPEIADYEVRRELLRRGATTALAKLDALVLDLEYRPLSTPVMRSAAHLWAVARGQGQPTAGPAELDGDVILAAQALDLNDPAVVVATANPAHLSRYVAAEQWELITP